VSHRQLLKYLRSCLRLTARSLQWYR
jgi:hypothetical protein